MGCRGLWDLYIHGKRYRLCHPRGRITYPDDKFTLQTLREILDKPDFLEQWEVVPCPSPLNTSLDYVYTVDHDVGLFTISMWGELNGSLAPAVTQFDLTEIYNATGVSLEKVRQESQFSFRDNVIGTEEIESKLLVSERLDIQLGMPTPLNELQERFFTDFVFQWRLYIDDPLTWTYSSPAFKIFCIAVLRLAAWDFEVVFDDPNAELPISFKSIPSWLYLKADIYWFHGYLVVLQEDIRSASMIENAISQAKAYTDNLDTRHDIVHLILLSPHHVVFAELLPHTVQVSRHLALFSNYSAIQPSPGFRALSRILSSNCWKKRPVHRERWQVDLPPEIVHAIIHKLEPRDAVALSQASFAVEECYYGTIPQFRNISVLGFTRSVPCCGKRGLLEENGVCCCQCYAWLHANCLGLRDWSPGEQYICTACRERKKDTALDPGGINRVSRRKKRDACEVKVGERIQSLEQQLSKPSHLRPDLIFRGNLLPTPPRLIQYTILFNGSFSGLAYGLEDTV